MGLGKAQAIQQRRRRFNFNSPLPSQKCGLCRPGAGGKNTARRTVRNAARNSERTRCSLA